MAQRGKLRIGVIGAGGIVAKLHLPALAKNRAYEVSLLTGRKEARLKLLCKRFKIPRWSQNFDDVIGDPQVDAVIIGTPHPAHVSWGIKALAAGKHVLMQKPLCGEMSEANAFVAAAEKSDRTVLVLPHFEPEDYTLRKLIHAGAIGKVSGAHARTSHGGPEIYYAEISDIFGETRPPSPLAGEGLGVRGAGLWFFDAKRAGVGALFDMGVYAVARLVAILGTVKRVSGFTATLDKPADLEDAATLLLQFESGAIATAETSWCDPARTWELSIQGTKGKFTIPDYGAPVTKWTPTSYTREDALPRRTKVKCGKGAGELHAHFLDCVRKGIQPPLSNVYAARHVTEIMLAGLESGRTGRVVEIVSKAV